MALLAPAVTSVPLLDEVASPTEDSALAIYGFDVDPFPGVLAIPPGDNPVHEAARRLPSAQEQVSAFLRPNGHIESFCDGVCDPE